MTLPMQDTYPSRTTPHARLLPRQDPVVHGEWSAHSPLSRSQSEAFDRDGFLILDALFSAAEVAALQAETDRLLASPASLRAETIITEPGSQEVRSIFEIHQQSALMQRLAQDQRLVNVARFLLGDEVYLHQSRLNYKPGFKGKEFYWHSDFETWHVEDGMPRMRALSMSVLLAPNTAHNGPLMLIPGSHRQYLTCVGETPDDHYKSSLKKQEYGVPDDSLMTQLAREHGIVQATGQPGSVILFDCNTMHGSNGNITPFPRSNAFFVYNAVSNAIGTPFGAVRPRPDFIAKRSVQALTPLVGSWVEGCA